MLKSISRFKEECSLLPGGASLRCQIKLKQSYTIHSRWHNSNEDEEDDEKEDGHLSKSLQEHCILSKKMRTVFFFGP